MVSVITTAYNRAKDLCNAIKSIKAQTFTDWEMVIVDDGSTDDTSETVAPFLADRRIKYLHQDNTGVARARNRGAREAQGKYLAFLDSDDQWLPEKLERQDRLMASKRGDALIYTNITYVSPAGQMLGELFATKATPQAGRVSEVLLVNNCVTTSSVMLPAEIFNQVGGFDERLNLKVGEDYELWLRVAAICELDYLVEPLVLYQVHPDQTTRKRLLVATNLLKLFVRILLKPDRYGVSRVQVSKALIKRMTPPAQNDIVQKPSLVGAGKHAGGCQK